MSEDNNSFLVLFLGPVKEYLENDEVSEIMINGPHQVYVELGGKAGIFTEAGVEIFPPKCDSIERNAGNAMFKCGVTDAMIESQRVRIDEQGNVIYPYALQQNL